MKRFFMAHTLPWKTSAMKRFLLTHLIGEEKVDHVTTCFNSKRKRYTLQLSLRLHAIYLFSKITLKTRGKWVEKSYFMTYCPYCHFRIFSRSVVFMMTSFWVCVISFVQVVVLFLLPWHVLAVLMEACVVHVYQLWSLSRMLLQVWESTLAPPFPSPLSLFQLSPWSNADVGHTETLDASENRDEGAFTLSYTWNSISERQTDTGRCDWLVKLDRLLHDMSR